MEDVTENNAGEEASPVVTSVASLGSMLREAREHLGLTVMDISSQIKFAPKQIEALEADDFEHLPEPAFVRGFVRSYAKVVHLDAETLLAAMPQAKPATAELTPQPVSEPRQNARMALQQNSTWLVGTLLVIIAVMGFALWHSKTPSEPTKVAQVEAPVVLPAETPASSAQPVAEPAAAAPEPPPEVQEEEKQPQKAQQPKAHTKAKASALAASAVPEAGAASSVTPKKKQAAQPGAPRPVASIRLEFTEDSWAEIKDKDGKILSSRVHTAGSELQLNGHPPLSVLVGNAPTVHLYFRGQEVDLAPHTRRSTGVASLTLE